MKSFMFPLFWRIFISIWLAMAVTVVASNLATRYLLDRERQVRLVARLPLVLAERGGEGERDHAPRDQRRRGSRPGHARLERRLRRGRGELVRG